MLNEKNVVNTFRWEVVTISRRLFVVMPETAHFGNFASQTAHFGNFLNLIIDLAVLP